MIPLLRFSHRECHKISQNRQGTLAGVMDSGSAAPELAGRLERFRQE